LRDYHQQMTQSNNEQQMNIYKFLKEEVGSPTNKCTTDEVTMSDAVGGDSQDSSSSGGSDSSVDIKL